jgi:hypothetical protein
MPTHDQSAEPGGYAQDEYRTLRETIQTRGSLRVAIAVGAWIAWAVLSLWCWTAATSPAVGPALSPVLSLIPLLVLAGAFEAVLALHTGVERIGRYVQRVFESGVPTPPAWEHVAVAMGGRWLSPGGLDPLFTAIFGLAAALNLLQSLAGAATLAPIEIATPLGFHAAFGLRLILARRFAARQRAADIAALDAAISSNSLVSRIQQSR